MMQVATFRFYAELNEFLSNRRGPAPLPFPLKDRTTVKHPIESFGVPHTEVALILVGGDPVPFDYLLQAGDVVSVFPHFRTLDLSPLPALRPAISRPIRFVLDVHLGQLATYLRLLGFDTLYRNDFTDPELATLSARTGRVLLSRDRRLLMRKQVIHGYCLRTRDPQTQIQAVLRRFDLADAISPWQRCLRCNARLEPVAKGEILHRLEPKTKRYYNEFHRCANCDRIYWKGSHYARMQTFVAGVLASANGQNQT